MNHSYATNHVNHSLYPIPLIIGNKGCKFDRQYEFNYDYWIMELLLTLLKLGVCLKIILLNSTGLFYIQLVCLLPGTVQKTKSSGNLASCYSATTTKVVKFVKVKLNIQLGGGSCNVEVKFRRTKLSVLQRKHKLASKRLYRELCKQLTAFTQQSTVHSADNKHPFKELQVSLVSGPERHCPT